MHQRLAVLALGVVLAAPTVSAQTHNPHAGMMVDDGPTQSMLEDPKREQAWTDATLELAGRWPVQDGGRVKPFSTWAGFTLLRLNGKRSIVTPDDEELTPTAWMLDVLFFPLGAAEYECFLIENDDVLTEIGLRFEDKKKRDRYSFEQLTDGLPKLFELGGEYRKIEEKNRSSVQNQIVVLYFNVSTFMSLAQQLDWARMSLPLDEEVRDLFGGATEVDFHEVLPRLYELRQRYEGADDTLARAAFKPLSFAAQLSEASTSFAFLPPPAWKDEAPGDDRLDLLYDTEVYDVEVIGETDDGEREVLVKKRSWLSPGELFGIGYDGEDVKEEYIGLMASVRELGLTRTNPAEFERALASVVAKSQAITEGRREYSKIPLEVTYYKANLIYWSLVLFVASFLGVAFLWLKPKSKVLYGLTSGTVTVATLLLIAAITLRCIIRGRPPVSTLYETLLFVAAVGTITALIIEWINRRRVALSLAAVVGMAFLFLANGYETLDKQDTMPSLVAVLDTNFWLATHVTAITAGYGAGMLAAFMGTAYLIMRMFKVRLGDRAFYSNFTRMVYGTLAFSVIFSTVGTILGGVWANDSWGRFWGWDPKENGALLIVISQLVVLHGRMGGYLREYGINAATAFTGTVIAFSWFGVNLLGVGLHSYGFTSGINTALWSYYYTQWGLIGVSLVVERRHVLAALLVKSANIIDKPKEESQPA